jgi:hypothetical protein
VPVDADVAETTIVVDVIDVVASDTTADDDLPDDPGAVLEDDVAAVLAEGEALERGEVAASADESEDEPDGPVPHED